MPQNIAIIKGNIDNNISLSAELSDLLNISANIQTLNSTINCEINGMCQIDGIITTHPVLNATLDIPEVVMSELYSGEYEINPKAHNATTLDTSGKTLIQDVVIKKIPYYETSNETGYTVYIANEV